MLTKLPDTVKVVEVGPRDGFQNVPAFISTTNKIAIIEGLIASGITSIELTSFVSPKAIPQLADAREVCQTILDRHGDKIEASVLVPNLKGAQLAQAAGIEEVVWVISVSETHNKANVNRTHDQSLADLAKMREAMPKLKVRVDLATAFACPFAGWVEPEAVAALAGKIIDLGIDKLVLCDTIGVATPDRVYRLATFMQNSFPDIDFSLHLHDTRGMGLVNTLAGLLAGITVFETSIGGLGGCPFAPGAAGNTSTEDLVNMLQGMHINTGIDLDKLLEVVNLVQEKVAAPLSSHMIKAKLYECLNYPV